MKPFLWLYAVLATLLFVSALTVSATPSYLVDYPFKGPSDIRRAQERGLDIVGVDYERHVMTAHVKTLKADLESLEVREVPFVPDARYKKPADVERIVKELASNHPSKARLEGIGRSLEGREIWALVVGTGKTAVLVDAMHHAREVMTPEVALDMAEQLVTESKYASLLQRVTVHIVPMVNPDGNEIVWTRNSMHRKNARGGYGVDINRNYPTDFNRCNGSSGNRGSDTYRGTGPASEPETKALIDYATKVRPAFNLSYHSFSEIVIYPFGCSPKRIPSKDRPYIEGVGAKLASLLVRDSGRGSYRAGTAYELLYNVDGGSLDHMYQAFGTVSFVVEVNGSQAGFQPPYSMRDVTVQRQRVGWEYILGEAAKR
jgi:carboxypeptidase T